MLTGAADSTATAYTTRTYVHGLCVLFGTRKFDSLTDLSMGRHIRSPISLQRPYLPLSTKRHDILFKEAEAFWKGAQILHWCLGAVICLGDRPSRDARSATLSTGWWIGPWRVSLDPFPRCDPRSVIASAAPWFLMRGEYPILVLLKLIRECFVGVWGWVQHRPSIPQ